MSLNAKISWVFVKTRFWLAYRSFGVCDLRPNTEKKKKQKCRSKKQRPWRLQPLLHTQADQAACAPHYTYSSISSWAHLHRPHVRSLWLEASLATSPHPLQSDPLKAFVVMSWRVRNWRSWAWVALMVIRLQASFLGPFWKRIWALSQLFKDQFIVVVVVVVVWWLVTCVMTQIHKTWI